MGYLPLIYVALICLSGVISFRLPSSTEPISYKLKFELDPNDESGNSFRGEAHIRFLSKVVTNVTVLHAKNLKIDKVSVLSPTNQNIYYFNNYANDGSDFLYIYLLFKMEAKQEYETIISFTGEYGVLDGIYRSSYMESTKRKWVLATNFVPTSARKVFPCYDEPRFRTTFSLEIKAPKEYSTFFHTAVLNRTSSDTPGYDLTVFANTSEISTHQLGFVVSSFSEKSNSVENKKISIGARHNMLEHVEFPLMLGRVSLIELEEFLNVQYNMPSLDMMAIPDTMVDAMESYGTLMYREEFLVYIHSETPSTLDQKIHTLICRQNAHLWFGNRLVPKSWDDLWMSEGFATYFEHLIVDLAVLEGNWRQVEQFVASDVHNVLHLDSLRYSRPMSSQAVTSSDIEAKFNFITSIKAASVLRMLHHVLGDEIFRDALTNYIEKFAEKTVTPSDLYNHLQWAAQDRVDLPEYLPTILRTWVDQSSYPLVYAERLHNSEKIFIYQQRYYHDRTISSDEKWWVPYKVITQSLAKISKTPLQEWLAPKTNNTYTSNRTEDWFYLNPGQTGYYRVMYDDENWRRLISVLRSPDYKKIPALNRAQLLDDSFALARSGRMSYSVALDLALYLEQEVDLIPWISAQRILNYLNIQYVHLGLPNHFETFKQFLIKNLYDSVGFDYPDDESRINKLTRNMAIDIAYNSYLDETWDKVNRYAQQTFRKSEFQLHPDLKAIVYCHALKFKEVPFQYIWEKYLSTNESGEKTILLNSLPCTQNTTYKEILLMKSIEDNYGIRNFDRTMFVIGVIKSNHNGLSLGLKFLKENYGKLQKKCQSPNTMAKLIEELANAVNTDEEILQFMLMHEFHRRDYSPSEMRASERAIETLYDNKRWRSESVQEINIWLKKNINSASAKNISSLAIFFSVILFSISSK